MIQYENPNPCVAAWGFGPDGSTCKTCVFLYVRQLGNRYFKCRKRKMTRGPATDHRVGWDACGKYRLAKPCPDCEGNGYIIPPGPTPSGRCKCSMKCGTCLGWGKVDV